MSIIGGIIKYFFILIGIIVAIGVIILGIMFIFPNVEIFGYKFYKGDNSTKYVYAYDENVAVSGSNINVTGNIARNFDALILNAKGFDITLATFEPTYIVDEFIFKYTFDSRMKGLKVAKDKTPYVEVKTENRVLVDGQQSKKVLELSVNEPEGIFIREKTNLTLYISSAHLNFESLYLDNKGGGTISIIGLQNKNISVQNLNVSSTGGTYLFNNIKVSNLAKIIKSSGSLQMNSDLSSSVYLDAGVSKAYFGNVSTSGVVQVFGSSPDVRFNTINANVELKAENGLFKANAINGQFSVSVLQTQGTTKSSNCDVQVGLVAKTLVIDNDSGKIEIGQFSTIGDSYNLDITTKSGNIVIENCFASNVKIKQNRGSTKVTNCIGDLNISTTYGSVEVSCLTKSSQISGVSQALIDSVVDNILSSKSINIETGRGGDGSGSIKVNNIRSFANLVCNNSGNIYATFDKIIGRYDGTNYQSSVINTSGAVDVLVNDKDAFLLKWDAKTEANVVFILFDSKEKHSTDVASSQKIEDGWIKFYSAKASTSSRLYVTSTNSQVVIYDDLKK